VPTASAILDRFLHHAMLIPITGQSYRLKDAVANRQKIASKTKE
jgi:DNA replication protein DnaC